MEDEPVVDVSERLDQKSAMTFTGFGSKRTLLIACRERGIPQIMLPSHKSKKYYRRSDLKILTIPHVCAT